MRNFEIKINEIELKLLLTLRELCEDGYDKFGLIEIDPCAQKSGIDVKELIKAASFLEGFGLVFA